MKKTAARSILYEDRDKKYLLMLCMSIWLVSCVDKKEKYREDFVRIQDYKGEGYTLRNSGTETSKIAKKNQKEIEIAVIKFFKETYKTEVKVHNIVGAKD